MAGRSGPPGGLSLCPGPGPRRGRRGSCSPTPSAPLSRLVLIATLKMASGGSGPGEEAVQLEPTGLGPLPRAFQRRLPAGCPGVLSTHCGSLGGDRPCLKPHSVVLPPGAGGGWGTGGSLAPSSSHDCVCCSACFPFLPHREAGQHRLSTRGPGRLCLGTGCRCAARRCG